MSSSTTRTPFTSLTTDPSITTIPLSSTASPSQVTSGSLYNWDYSSGNFPSPTAQQGPPNGNGGGGGGGGGGGNGGGGGGNIASSAALYRESPSHRPFWFPRADHASLLRFFFLPYCVSMASYHHIVTHAPCRPITPWLLTSMTTCVLPRSCLCAP
ncbi:hypothetical protein NMY22_g5299 [Coprinellus aureogranulatus]|nr:hypothetical protein NMY22_g5299 [Coprinellus aureogranulatus]